MGRPRSFDEDEVVGRAMLAFWDHGYEGASIATLERATGLGRVSLYNAFGDKHGLFMRGLDRYKAMATAFFDEGFADGGLASIEGLLASLQEPKAPDAPQHRGCLMVNAILGAGFDENEGEATTVITAARTQMIEGFEGALRTARSRGEVEGDDRLLRDRAELLVSILWGARVTARLRGDAAAEAGTARAAADMVAAWRRR